MLRYMPPKEKHPIITGAAKLVSLSAPGYVRM
jgi:hypothetical protein